MGDGDRMNPLFAAAGVPAPPPPPPAMAPGRGKRADTARPGELVGAGLVGDPGAATAAQGQLVGAGLVGDPGAATAAQAPAPPREAEEPPPLPAPQPDPAPPTPPQEAEEGLLAELRRGYREGREGKGSGGKGCGCILLVAIAAALWFVFGGGTGGDVDGGAPAGAVALDAGATPDIRSGFLGFEWGALKPEDPGSWGTAAHRLARRVGEVLEEVELSYAREDGGLFGVRLSGEVPEGYTDADRVRIAEALRELVRESCGVEMRVSASDAEITGLDCGGHGATVAFRVPLRGSGRREASLWAVREAAH